MLGDSNRQKHSRARDRTGNLLGPYCERDAMTIRPRDLIINICLLNGSVAGRVIIFAWPNGHGVSLTTRSEKVPGSIPGATSLFIINQVAWPNGHGVSLTIRSEKVPGSIPGATMFLVGSSC
ncbi:hypothetical protein N7516_002332 [Penicillium verrucosum]|uniref:uncharacterized protein n=1 Tax=Penicillium verrucosum TaxID=60171 RepID=UPI0025454BF6|nr:uncharacterized protein N7516_002332 [Penicillium verrucosum]KAJ5942164.1 hypothetical protein N7516_002332 [Penicillium verrucosum]